MIDLVKNKKKLEQEKKKFKGAETCEEEDENFSQLLDQKEDDPEFAPLVKEYREAKARLARYMIKEQALNIDFFEALRDTKEIYNKLFDLEDKILDLHYKQILREES